MNIIVKPHGSDLCYCRPDTTWERENKDFYVPDCVSEMHWAPVIFVRISKAGKCINPKFVSRYYDSFNFGTLLYCRCEQGQDMVSCADHTSLLPSPMLGAEQLKEEHKEIVEDAICKASKLISVRIGDYVAVELDEIKRLTASEIQGIKVIF